jgi:hypothetical protein
LKRLATAQADRADGVPWAVGRVQVTRNVPRVLTLKNCLNVVQRRLVVNGRQASSHVDVVLASLQFVWHVLYTV